MEGIAERGGEDGAGGADAERFDRQVEFVVNSEALGRSPMLERLLRYLASQSRVGHAPKEVEIAEAVFARGGDLAGDASVRVYLHRLRRKLEDFYAGPGASEPLHLSLPKGSYRLLLLAPDTVPETEPTEDADEAEPHAEPIGRASRTRGLPIRLVVVIAAIALGCGWLIPALIARGEPAASVRRAAVWRPFIGDARRLGLALGDYYLLGEVDDRGRLVRFVRDFAIPSPVELEDLRMREPERAARLKDLGIAYVPIGVGEAMRVLMPVVAGGAIRPADVFTIGASDLDAGVVSASNIVYLGYVSGLATMRYPVFGGSRFAVGGGYDELFDRRTGKRYLADSRFGVSGAPSQEYAIISSVKGPTGNRILVIAGTSDAALMQAARFVSEPETAHALDGVASTGASFEALLSVDALENVGLRSTLLVAATRPDPNWSKPVSIRFPAVAP